MQSLGFGVMMHFAVDVIKCKIGGGQEPRR